MARAGVKTRPACYDWAMQDDSERLIGYLAPEGFVAELQQSSATPCARRMGGWCSPTAGAAGRLGGQCLAGPGAPGDRLDRRCGEAAARDPAQLGALFRRASPPRGADRGAAAEGFRQTAEVRRSRRRRRRWARGPCSIPNTLLASARCSSAFPNGEVQFVEDKTVAEPRLSQALGAVHGARRTAGAG